jgi:tripartite-type tricarboxylate transporter receptor subunit TctC
MACIHMTHVPYRGGGPAINDLIAGQVQVMFIAPGIVTQHIAMGKLRALAVTTMVRSDVLPDVPAMADFLPGYQTSGWFGIGVRTGTPKSIIAMLNKKINACLAELEIKSRIAAMGATVLAGSPDDFGKLIADETAKFAKVIVAAKVKMR